MPKLNKEQQARFGSYKRCFATDDGKYVLEDLKKMTHFYRAHFPSGAAIDEKLLLYDEARRALVLGIIQKVEREFTEDSQQETATS